MKGTLGYRFYHEPEQEFTGGPHTQVFFFKRELRPLLSFDNKMCLITLVLRSAL